MLQAGKEKSNKKTKMKRFESNLNGYSVLEKSGGILTFFWCFFLVIKWTNKNNQKTLVASFNFATAFLHWVSVQKWDK